MKDWETDTFLARWLNDELSPEEKKDFESSDEFEHYQQIRAALENYEAPAFDEEAALKEAMGRIQSNKTKVVSMNNWVRYMLAASILLLACLGIYWTIFNDTIVELTALKQEEINLPDGSSIALSKGSFIQYNETDWEEKREIQLKGEAFFEVEKGEAFEVVLAQGRVSVLGTSFNIIEREEGLEVVCYTGKVKVEAYGQVQIIEAGQLVFIQKGQEIRMEKVYLNEPLWVDRIASYKNVQFPIVLEQLKALYNVQIMGDYDSTLHYTGQFPTDDLEIALEQLFGPYQIEYSFEEESRQLHILND